MQGQADELITSASISTYVAQSRGFAPRGGAAKNPRHKVVAKKPVTSPHTQAMVHGDVFPSVRRFAEGGELHGLPAPAFIDDSPLLFVRGGVRRIRHGRDAAWDYRAGSVRGRPGPGMTGSSESPLSTRPSP